MRALKSSSAPQTPLGTLVWIAVKFTVQVSEEWVCIVQNLIVQHFSEMVQLGVNLKDPVFEVME